MSHTPVLLAEAIGALALKDEGVYVDATFGAGGYSRAMLAHAQCRVIAIDRDPDAESRAAALSAEFPQRFTFREGNFGDVVTLAGEQVDGVVFDLGVSSFQFDEAGRGFSFQADADLDMRMERQGNSAASAVNHLSEAALGELIAVYGEDDDARRIARAIVQARAAAPVTRTLALAALIERAVGGRRGARIHPATKTFQALRMLVNDEPAELARGLGGAEELLKPDGRLAVVSFHSLEDRMVKTFLSERAGAAGRGSRHEPEPVQTRAPSFHIERRRATAPSEDELAVNPRARSASMRWAARTQAPPWGPVAPLVSAPKAQAEWEKLSA